MTSKELKLRLINEPLSYEETNRIVSSSSSCCIYGCCEKDYTTQLSKEERVIKLTIGYARLHSSDEIPSDVCSLCIDYVGGAAGFTLLQLASDTEIKKYDKILKKYDKMKRWNKRCKCCNQWSCYYDSIDCGCYEFNINSFGFSSNIWIICCEVVCALVYFVGKDFAALSISINNDCPLTEDKYVSFDVYTWLDVASVVHLTFMMFMC